MVLNILLVIVLVMFLITGLSIFLEDIKDFINPKNKRYVIILKGGFEFRTDKETAYRIYRNITHPPKIGRSEYYSKLDVLLYYDDVVKISKGKKVYWEKGVQ